nr:hypothetical protein [Egibacter rhizosphaerae]
MRPVCVLGVGLLFGELEGTAANVGLEVDVPGTGQLGCNGVLVVDLDAREEGLVVLPAHALRALDVGGLDVGEHRQGAVKVGLNLLGSAFGAAERSLRLVDPAVQRGLGDPDVLGDPPFGHLALERHGHHVSLELQWVVLGRVDILP